MTEQNWRDLPAGRELDRLVAERMGYEVIDYARDVVGVDDDQPNPVFKPESDEHALMQVMKPVPHYSTSVDAALTLPVTDGAWDITCDTAQGYAQVFINPHAEIWDGPTTWHDGQDRELALLMCRAWLAWKDGTA